MSTRLSVVVDVAAGVDTVFAALTGRAWPLALDARLRDGSTLVSRTPPPTVATGRCSGAGCRTASRASCCASRPPTGRSRRPTSGARPGRTASGSAPGRWRSPAARARSGARRGWSRRAREPGWSPGACGWASRWSAVGPTASSRRWSNARRAARCPCGPWARLPRPARRRCWSPRSWPTCRPAAARAARAARLGLQGAVLAVGLLAPGRRDVVLRRCSRLAAAWPSRRAAPPGTVRGGHAGALLGAVARRRAFDVLRRLVGRAGPRRGAGGGTASGCRRRRGGAAGCVAVGRRRPTAGSRQRAAGCASVAARPGAVLGRRVSAPRCRAAGARPALAPPCCWSRPPRWLLGVGVVALRGRRAAGDLGVAAPRPAPPRPTTTPPGGAARHRRRVPCAPAAASCC